MEIEIDKITIGERKRRTDELKVIELANSITEIGLLNPITVAHLNGGYKLIAGLHRLEAFKQLGRETIPALIIDGDQLDFELAEIDENLVRSELTVLERGELLSRRKEIYETLHPEVKQYIAGGIVRQNSASEIISFAEDTATKVGTSRRTIEHEIQIATKITPEAKDIIRNTPLADNKTELLKLARIAPDTQIDVVRKVVSGESPNVQKARAEIEKSQTSSLPSGKYRVIYADPPWEYNNRGPDYYGPAERHYPTMSIDELCAMGEQIREIIDDNAVLFLWVTSPMLEAAFKVISAWCFTYKTSFVWDKVEHNFGHYNSVRHELLLVCTRGSCIPDIDKKFDSVVTIERGKHSEKPEEFRNIIDTLYTRGRKLELFARRKVTGWDCWGAEVRGEK